MLARRLGGKFGGAWAVWAFALSPVVIQDYSLITSDVLVACMLAWALLLTVGEGRPAWQIATGAFLSGLILMTRQNMLPLIPVIIGYIFWQHGRRTGWQSLIACLLPILVITSLYWPRISGLWEVWLPILRSFRSDFFPSPFADTTPYRTVSFPGLDVKLIALIDGFRFNYFSLVGGLSTLLLWPSPKNREWKHGTRKKTAVFLAFLFFSLVGLHGWASLGNDFSPFSFATYLNYFNFSAFLLVIVSFPHWEKAPSALRTIGIVLFVTALFAGLSYSAFLDPIFLGDSPLTLARAILYRITFLPVPWLRSGHFVPGGIPLSVLLANKFGWNVDFLQNLPYDASAQQYTFITTVLIGVWLTLALVYALYRPVHKKREFRYNFGSLALIAVLLSGCFLSPLAKGEYAEAAYCESVDMLSVYEYAGAEMGRLIPPSSHVYWGVDTPTLLLYLPGVIVPPAQLYGTYSRRIGGNTDELLREGYWNDEAAARWLQEADFIVLDQDNLNTVEPNALGFDLLRVISTDPCHPQYRLYIFGKRH